MHCCYSITAEPSASSSANTTSSALSSVILWFQFIICSCSSNYEFTNVEDCILWVKCILCIAMMMQLIPAVHFVKSIRTRYIYWAITTISVCRCSHYCKSGSGVRFCASVGSGSVYVKRFKKWTLTSTMQQKLILPMSLFHTVW